MQHFQELYDYNPLDDKYCKRPKIYDSRINWISVIERLPEDRTLVWIYVEYDKSPYDNVRDRISIGTYYNNNRWQDLLDFLFADDYEVKYWMPIEFPKKPNQKV